MVRGNWQKRVERSEARKTEAREKKGRRSHRKEAHQNFRGLSAFLAACGSTDGIHLWVDKVPRRSEDEPADNAANSLHKVEEQDYDLLQSLFSSSPKGRKVVASPRSRIHQKEKKIHPRSKGRNLSGQSATQSPPNPPDNELYEKRGLLCKNQFFLGTCRHAVSGASQKGRSKSQCGGGAKACPHVHYYHCHSVGAESRTLADTVHLIHSGSECQATKEEVKKSAANALPSSTGDEMDGGGMDMVYYLYVPTEETATCQNANSQYCRETESDDDENTKTSLRSRNRFVDTLHRTLTQNNIHGANVVYVVTHHQLIYDRNRGGLLIGDNSIEDQKQDRNVRARGNCPLPSGYEFVEGDSVCLNYRLLPVQLLELVLRYLPDIYVARVSLVCKDWSDQVGKSSPDLWRFLLERRGWPIPVLEGEGGKENPLEKSPDEFGLNLKENEQEDGLRAVPSVDVLVGRQANHTKLLRQSFLSHYRSIRDVNALWRGLQWILSGSKPNPSSEAAVQVFKATEGAPRHNNECVALRIWERKKSHDAYESGENLTMSRSKCCTTTAALGAFRGDGTIRVFEGVGQGSLSSCASICRQTACMRAVPNSKHIVLLDFDMDGTFIYCHCGHVGVDDSQKGASLLTLIRTDDIWCAGGEDHVESTDVINLSDMAASHPVVEERIHAIDGSEVHMNICGRIVACGQGQIMFVAEIDSMQYLCIFDCAQRSFRSATDVSSHFGANVTVELVAILGNGLTRGKDWKIEVVARALDRATTADCSVFRLRVSFATDTTNAIEQATCILSAGHSMGEDWRLQHRNVAVVADTVAIVDVISGTSCCKLALSVYKQGLLKAADLLQNEVNTDSTYLLPIGRDHLFLVCLNNLQQGNRFALLGSDIHLPTCREIERLVLEKATDFIFTNMPLHMASLSDAVAVCASSFGLVMTGPSVRSAVESISMSPGNVRADKKPKKKKKRNASSKTSKKDGFARGMSLRG